MNYYDDLTRVNDLLKNLENIDIPIPPSGSNKGISGIDGFILGYNEFICSLKEKLQEKGDEDNLKRIASIKEAGRVGSLSVKHHLDAKSRMINELSLVKYVLSTLLAAKGRT